MLVPFADSWKYTSLAECCYENFQFLFQECVGDSFGEDVDLPPCSPPPELSGLWYVNYLDGEDDECVRECHTGDFCNGRSSNNNELHPTFDDCCSKHLWWLEDSPCEACSENFWEAHFSTTPPPETGYYPVCKS